MPQQYTATDSRGLKVTLEGEFPPERDDRIRIAATSNLFTRLMATVLATPSTEERRALFRSLEMALEWADAAARQDMEEMNRIVQRFMAEAGVSTEQLADMLRQLQEQGPPPGWEGGPWPPFGSFGPTEPPELPPEPPGPASG